MTDREHKTPAKTASRSVNKAGGPAATQEKIAAMPEPFRAVGERLHALIVRAAPSLQPTVWYGMPAYAKDGKTICFFRADKKYMTLGITQDANLVRHEGAPNQLIASAWYFAALDEATEAELSAIVHRIGS